MKIIWKLNESIVNIETYKHIGSRPQTILFKIIIITLRFYLIVT